MKSSAGANATAAAARESKGDLENSCWDWVDRLESEGVDYPSSSEVARAYRLHFPAHFYPEQNCHQNCKYNPRCFCALGLSKWITEDDVAAGDVQNNCTKPSEPDTVTEIREPGLPAGLRNLGNTCYVNSFLQIWFHNIRFRQALYEWNPEEDEEERDNETVREVNNYKPKGKVASLQALFAMMDFTNRKAVDPNDFIAKLGLDPQVQQDAQEFSKLFMSLLESNLATQKRQRLQQLVQAQFRGQYAYVTKCSSCGRESDRPSYFYELDLTLQGLKTLLDCLSDYLKEEELRDDNKYFCEGCQTKQNATRCVRLLQLPPVLNLQLNRFVFDMRTGRKKKLNSAVQFPEQLDLSKYLLQPAGTFEYCLTGVLMHVGPDANHGHYLAHIQEVHTGQWFKFSDELVEQLAGKNPKLGLAADPYAKGSKSEKRTSVSSNGKLPKGIQSSNNAYMLVYMEKNRLQAIRKEVEEKRRTKSSVPPSPAINNESKSNRKRLKRRQRTPQFKRRKMVDESRKDSADHSADESENVSEKEDKGELETPVDGAASTRNAKNSSKEYEYSRRVVYPRNFPKYLKAYIEQDRRHLDEEVREADVARQSLQSWKKNIGKQIRELASGLKEPLEPTEAEYLPTKWLQHFLAHPNETSKIETINFLCIHGMLDYTKLQQLKLLNTKVVNRLYAVAGAGHGRRLDWSSFCSACVRNQYRSVILARKSAMHAKRIAELSKKDISESDPAFWVGKQSFKTWRQRARIALNALMMQEAQLERRSAATNNTSECPENVSGEVNGDHNQSSLAVIAKDVGDDDGKDHSSLPNGKALKDENHAGDSDTPQSDPLDAIDLVGKEGALNSDIICKHGQLVPKEKDRRLVCLDTWNILKSHFPQAKDFPRDRETCAQCRAMDNEAALDGERRKEIALSQKSLLFDMLNERNRPSWAKVQLEKVYLVSRSFVQKWRQFIRSPLSHEPVICLGNSSLLCDDHQGLVYPVDLDTESDYESIVYMVSEEEWSHLRKLFEVDVEITVTRKKGLMQSDSSGLLLFSRPEVCLECLKKRKEKEEQEKLTYFDVPVFVRRLWSGEKAPKCSDDPDFGNGLHMSNSSNTFPTTPTCDPSKLENSVRRSARRQKVRGERKVFVSSDMLLRDLKVKIMELFNVAPYDQHLSLDGLLLEESGKTLAELKVLPRSLIYLKADEPDGTDCTLEESWSASHPEEGFKGTGLLSGF